MGVVEVWMTESERLKDTEAELHDCLRRYHRLAMNVMHIEYSSRYYQLYATFGCLAELI